MSSTSEVKRLARRVPEDVATEGNLDLVEELYAEDFVEHGPFGREIRGVEAARENMEQFREAFSNFEAVVDDVVAEGDTAAMRVTLRGTHDGPFLGFEPTGNDFEVRNMVFTRIADGKIVERWVQPDGLSMLQQLDVLPADLPAGTPADD